jgi:hypothetical protein
MGLLNVAVQVALPETLIVVVEAVPEQPPPHPAKVDPPSGVAVSWTLPVSGAIHVVPQFIPAGTEVTIPIPVPGSVTVRVPPSENVAMQLWSEVARLIVVVKAVPEQSALQPVKLDPESATAVSWTDPLKGALWIGQDVPQWIPVGDEVTVPVPLPLF